MSSVAETSRVKDDLEESLSRRRGLRLVACLAGRKADEREVEKNANRHFNIAISENVFSEVPRVNHEMNSEKSPRAYSDFARGAEMPRITGLAGIGITLLVGGIIGYLIGYNRK